MKTRINNKEQEINVSQPTQEGLSDEITHEVVTQLDMNGKEVVRHQYTISGKIYTTNIEVSEYELRNLQRVIKEQG
jgi:hypothetical protein